MNPHNPSTIHVSYNFKVPHPSLALAVMESTLVSGSILSTDVVREQQDVKKILQDYLERSMATDDVFRLAEAYQTGKLYQDVSDKVSDFIKAAGDNPKTVEPLTTVGCEIAGNTYKHTSPQHQYYIALFTACVTYADDLGGRHIEALGQFSHRFATGEMQLSPALDVLAGLLKQSYDLWPEVGADGIVSGTLMAITAMYLEYTTGNMPVTPRATWWPNYFRNKTGICSPYAHFNFPKGWRSTPDSYLQLLPYIEFFICSCNDVLSFYKEELIGETANYMHIRATADGSTPIEILRSLANETLACEERVSMLIGEDRELMAIWRSHEQGFIAFHMKTPRYRLGDLTVPKDD